MSGDPEQEYFADGMVEDIITALSRFKSLFVIARNSSFTYKGKAVDIKQVGRELGVRYVLEGSVRKAGGRVRITGQLIEAATGTHICGRTSSMVRWRTCSTSRRLPKSDQPPSTNRAPSKRAAALPSSLLKNSDQNTICATIESRAAVS